MIRRFSGLQAGVCERPGDNNNKNSPKAEPFVSASDGEV